MARALVRWLEIQRLITFLEEQIAELPEADNAVSAPMPALRPDRLAVSLIEGWRGEIAHVAATGADGQLDGYKIVDPSNLSYAGHDL